jgi:hypothetical protein
LREVKAPTLLRRTTNRWQQGCQPYAPAAVYPPPSVCFLRFLVLISVRGCVEPSATVRPEKLGTRILEKIHLIGKLSRDLPVCSIMPQPLCYFVPLFSRPKPLLFHSSSSLIVLMRLNGPRSQKIR